MNIAKDYNITVVIGNDEVVDETTSTPLKKVAAFLGFETQVLGGTQPEKWHTTMVVHTFYVEPRENQNPLPEEVDWIESNGTKYTYYQAQRHNEKMVKIFINNQTLVDPSTGQEVAKGYHGAIGELDYFKGILQSTNYFDAIRAGIESHDQREGEKNKFTLDVNGHDILWMAR